jgi:hypothetical protein
MNVMHYSGVEGFSCSGIGFWFGRFPSFLFIFLTLSGSLFLVILSSNFFSYVPCVTALFVILWCCQYKVSLRRFLMCMLFIFYSNPFDFILCILGCCVRVLASWHSA